MYYNEQIMSEYDFFEEALSKFESEKNTTTSESESSSCLHEKTINDKNIFFCAECGEQICVEKNFEKEWRYYGDKDTKNHSNPTRVHMRKNDDKNIYKDVENMGFDENIVELANKIYHQVTKDKIKRGKSRKSIVFACVFEAYKLRDNPQTYDTIIDSFNIPKKSGLAGINHVSLYISKEMKSKTTYITPKHLIHNIMYKFKGATEAQYEQVAKIYDKIKNRNTKINRARPQSVAAGIVFYWLQKNNKSITLKEFTKVVNLSELTIKNMAKLVDEIIEKRKRKKKKKAVATKTVKTVKTVKF